MTAFEIHVKILQITNFFHKNTWLFQVNKIIDSHVEDLNFYMYDRIPWKNFVNSTRR